MKLFRCLPLFICLGICAGCSSPNTGQQHGASANSPAIVQTQNPSCSHHVFKSFVDGWILGEAPPPDFPQPGNQGNEAWTLLGLPLEWFGETLAR